MKIGIDSYCFHRFFGEVYDGQVQPEKMWKVDDFLEIAKKLDVDGVSLESCFFPSFEESYLVELKAKLDAYGFERVYAWGHPSGLERGQNQELYEDLCASIPRARRIGAEVMRVCGSSGAFFHEPHQPQIKALIAQFREAMKIADAYGVKLAMENHQDYNADEMLQIVEGVAHPNFGVTFDTGNFIRVLDDPNSAVEKLAKHTLATHIKDVLVNPEAKANDWFFFSSTPVGYGLVDTVKVAKTLRQADYQGLFAIEIDFPHPNWTGFEEEMVSMSVKKLRDIRNTMI